MTPRPYLHPTAALRPKRVEGNLTILNRGAANIVIAKNADTAANTVIPKNADTAAVAAAVVVVN
jgi:hypothetical protein